MEEQLSSLLGEYCTVYTAEGNSYEGRLKKGERDQFVIAQSENPLIFLAESVNEIDDNKPIKVIRLGKM